MFGRMGMMGAGFGRLGAVGRTTAAAPAYAINMIDFDGSSNLGKTYTDSDIPPGTDGLLSVWLELDVADGGASAILNIVDGSVYLTRNNSNQLNFVLAVDGGGSLVDCNIAGITASLGRIHVAYSWSLVATPIFQAYVNGSVVTPSFNAGPTPGNVDYVSQFGVSRIGNFFGTDYNGRMGDLFFTNQFLDLSNPANLAKLISGGQPVYMGDTAQLPTGTQAKVAFSGNAAHWMAGNGRGSLGGWTPTGTLTNA